MAWGLGLWKWVLRVGSWGTRAHSSHLGAESRSCSQVVCIESVPGCRRYSRVPTKRAQPSDHCQSPYRVQETALESGVYLELLPSNQISSPDIHAISLAIHKLEVRLCLLISRCREFSHNLFQTEDLSLPRLDPFTERAKSRLYLLELGHQLRVIIPRHQARPAVEAMLFPVAQATTGNVNRQVGVLLDAEALEAVVLLNGLAKICLDVGVGVVELDVLHIRLES